MAVVVTTVSSLLSLFSAFVSKARRQITIKIGGVEVQLDKENPEESLNTIRQLLVDMAVSPRISLLYSASNRNFARRLSADLENRGVDVWVDEKNIHVGDKWPEKVESALAESQWIVVVLPREDEQPRWINRELAIAMKVEQERERPLILPVLPPDGSLPPLLSDRIYADFRSDYHTGLESLLEAMKVRKQAGSGTVGNVSSINFSKEDQRTEWRIYEVAFLWHDQVPPGVEAHFKQMSRDVEETKVLLHRAVESGTLPMLRQERYQNGVTRWVGREDLVRFALSRGEKPRFLFPDERYG
ncbi:MAG: toll/interleukin-1 receptor domain-containing protein [Nitrospira sp.]|nr:toll/interleukin-1 receptor domain-containing protein [Nitrospira sp.]